MTNLELIVAYDQNRAIGRDGNLPWEKNLPDDLKHFRKLTVGKSVIMGRKTFESIGRALPERQNIVITSRNLKLDGIVIAHSLAEALNLAENSPVIIGGATVYKQALSKAKTIYATEVHHRFASADAFFPTLDENWTQTSKETHAVDARNLYAYDFVTYERKT